MRTSADGPVPLVREDRGGGVTLLSFARPEQANTWSTDLHAAFLATLQDLADDPTVRAVVVTGQGRFFCAGADMGVLDEIVGNGTGPEDLDSRSYLEAISFPKPLVAAINGAAAGLGLVNALLCDVRFAARGAVLTTSFARRGLVAEHGIAWLLTQVVGRAHALDLLLSARRIDTDEALQIGLVTKVLAPDEVLDAALDYARDLAANCSPASMRAIKHQVLHHAVMTLDASEDQTELLVEASLRGVDLAEGVASFTERRQPAFEPLGRGTTFPSIDPPAGPATPTATSGGDSAGRVAEQFFSATQTNDWEAALGLLAPDVTVTTYPGRGPGGIDGLAQGWQQLRDACGPWLYSQVRRSTWAGGFTEQHTVTFTDLGVELDACVVATLDGGGRICSLEEYVDAAPLRDARRARREPTS